MSIDDGDFDRLVAGRSSADDASVSAFLDELRSAYPPGPTAGFEAEHLAAMARESRIVAATREHAGANVLSLRRTRFRRILVSSVAGATVLLTAGVGAAAAMGINPIAQLVAPRIQQMPVTPTPAPSSEGIPPASDGGRPGNGATTAPSIPPASVPTVSSTADPTVTASSEPTKTDKTKKAKKPKKAKKDKSDKTNNGKSDKEKDKADKTNDGASTDR